MVRETHSLWPAARLLGLLNSSYLPSAAEDPDQLQRGVDLMNLGAHAHQVGLVMAVLTAWGLFMDEINKFCGGRCMSRDGSSAWARSP